MNMKQSGAHRSLIARTAFLCAPYFVVLTACAMAASDNITSAAAVLRRLASGDEATLRAALAYMGRTPFQRLRRAVGRTETPLPSNDEGGSGPAGAQGSSSPFRLDPAENVTNQATASSEANANNLDPALGTDSFLAAVSSPTTSMATQDPVWPPASGGLTSLESYLISTEAIDTAQPLGETAAATSDPTSSSAPTAGFTSTSATAPTTLVEHDAQPGVTPPQQGEDTMLEGRPPKQDRPPACGSGPRAAYRHSGRADGPPTGGPN